MLFEDKEKEFWDKGDACDCLYAQVHEGKEGTLKYIHSVIECDEETALKIYVNMPKPSQLTPAQIAAVNAPKNAPKCPTCQSTNVKKISITKKVVGGTLFGLFSSDVRKTMHCKNCGYKW